MRGKPEQQLAMLSSLSTEDLIPKDHPIRRIRVVVDAVLAEMDGEFDAMYSRIGRPSVPPEQLLKATILMALYTVRSERAFCERLNYDLLFKWFLDLAIDASPSTRPRSPRTATGSSSRESRIGSSLPWSARRSCAVTSRRSTSPSTALCCRRGRRTRASNPRTAPATDPPAGTQRRSAWHGQKRSNQTHESTTDPESRLYRKSHNTAAMLCYSGHLLMENRNALIVDAELTFADGYAERATALEMLARLPQGERRRTVAADKGYDTRLRRRHESSGSPRTSPSTPTEPTISDRRSHHQTRRP